MSDRAKETLEDNHVLAGVPDERVRGWLLEALAERAEQAEPEPDEIEARALLDSFDGRITGIERRIDRVLARLDAG